MDRREGMAAQGHTPYFTHGGGGGGGFHMAPPQCAPPFSTLHQSLPLPTQSSNSSEDLSGDSTHHEDDSQPPPPPPPLPAYVGSSSGGGSAHEEGVKRKRGRPRKYGPDGKVGLTLLTSPGSGEAATPKRGRGRPPGTGTKQQLASYGEWFSSSAGMGFIPHAIEISAGEDMAAKIMSFSQQGPRAICIMSATGVISSVTLRQPDTSGGTVTYEGRFEILCLSGSYFLADYGSSHSRAGSLSITLSSPDGRVIGGAVGGQLIAASPVQVMVGSFIYGGGKVRSKPKPKPEADLPWDSERMSRQAPLEEGPLPIVAAWPDSKEMVDKQEGHIDINQIRS